MKILTIHADFIEFQAKKKAFKGAEEDVTKEAKRIEECLVVFTAAEKSDEQNESVIKEKYISEIQKIANQVNATNIVLYPYAHLSSDLANPKFAQKIMIDSEKELSVDKSFSVYRAPFGWYKSFNISCKGHPLSELSRNITAEEKSTHLKREFKDELFELSVEKLSKAQRLSLSTAFILAKALHNLYPKSQIGEMGFYQDQSYVDVSGVQLHNNNFPKIEKEMHKIISSKDSITQNEKVKLESWQKQIQTDLGKSAKAYSLKDLCVVPLFKEPFAKKTSDIGAFKILALASAYWKSNQNNEQLVRINCIGFSKKTELDSYLQTQVDAQNRSHLKIGKEQGLFVVSKLVGAGLPLLAPKGTIIRNEVIKFLWELHKDRGYQQVCIPHIAKPDLYKASGHWDKFGDELFHVKGKYEEFVMKPMNCPHHIQIFDAFSYSYRDMPIRFFEPTMVYRDEKPGQLIGLSRVRSISQDDGHIFCRVSQIKQEVKTMVDVILEFYNILGMDTGYWVSLSVRDDDMSKYLGDKKIWQVAENALHDVAKEQKLPFKKIKGEAAFYGPKLDFMFKDALGRERQLSTIQLDFNLPERFNLSFMNEKGVKERPVMMHRAIAGSLERFMGILIEHFAGKFPVWLSPVQVKLLTVTDRSNAFAQKVYDKMREHDIRVEIDSRSETIGKKVREAQLEQANYIITIGDTEVKANTLAVRSREGVVEHDVLVQDFVEKIIKEIKNRSL
jgi:threonyl-tRNA synthetase